jgi:hypothetical protein
LPWIWLNFQFQDPMVRITMPRDCGGTSRSVMATAVARSTTRSLRKLWFCWTLKRSK